MRGIEDEVTFVECRWCCYGASSVDPLKAESKVDAHERAVHPERFTTTKEATPSAS